MLPRGMHLGVCLALLAAWVAEGAEMYCVPDNCYDVLEVKQSDDAATIKKAYRNVAKKWHPDKNQSPEATAMFQKIGKAYEVLSDEALRDAYNYFLEHPEQAMYNKMRYYKAAYQPKTPIWIVLLGLTAIFSWFQMQHWKERARAFEESPAFAQALEDEYLANCTMGRHGYQNGELSDERKEEIEAAWVEAMSNDPECPLSKPFWSNTVLPYYGYVLPSQGIRWLIWRIKNHKEIMEKARKEEEERLRKEEEERLEREEKERYEAEMAEKKAKKEAARIERERKEAEKRDKLLKEIEQEEEKEIQKFEEEEAKKEMIFTGKVASADELRKKGHMLLEIIYGPDGAKRVQIVTDKPVSIGQEVTVAIEGAEMPNGKTAQRTKIAGEWSEGVILSFGAKAGSAGAAEEQAEGQAEEMPAKGGGEEEKVKQRKKKRG